MFGLADLNTFSPIITSRHIEASQQSLGASAESYYDESCNIECVYSSFDKKDYCADCCIDSIPNRYFNPIIEGYFLDDQYCDYIGTLDSSSNVMSDIIVPETLGINYGFTPTQILRMRANIALQYIDPKTNALFSGVLKTILTSGAPIDCRALDESSPVIEDTDAILSCDEGLAKSQQITRQNYEYQSNVNGSDRAINFSNLVTRINNITDNFL
jgi:hypothetical protein